MAARRMECVEMEAAQTVMLEAQCRKQGVNAKDCKDAFCKLQTQYLEIHAVVPENIWK